MKINTREIKKGIITIDGHNVQPGISLDELERILQRTIGVDSEHVGYVTGGMAEDEKPVSITTWFQGDKVKHLKVNVGEFHTIEEALAYMNQWLEERDVEWIAETYYQTDFGYIEPQLVRTGYALSHYEIEISLEYRKVPRKTFPAIQENKQNTVYFTVHQTAYKVQRIPSQEVDNLPLHNGFGNEPMSLHERRYTHSKDDRKEFIYFAISKIEEEKETILGIAEFHYLAIGESYKNGELFFVLDGHTEEWGILGLVVEKSRCGLHNKTGFTPYLLLFHDMHGEIPLNKDFTTFQDDKDSMEALFDAVAILVADYVHISEEQLTLVQVSDEKRDELFPYRKKLEDIYVHYRRFNKERIETDIDFDRNTTTI